jgi:hypothetical protein
VTRQEAPFVVKTVLAARKGRASLPELARAHHLAAASGFSGIAGELTERIAEKSKPSLIITWPGILFGLAIGVGANLISRLFNWPTPPRTPPK